MRRSQSVTAGRRLLVSLLFCFVVLLPESGRCTETYASETGKSCEACHLDPSGGGPLTEEGAAFRQGLIQTKGYRPLSRTQRVARLLIGYLHTVTAILWFGTILYVHLLLRPSYAARGLPRAELMLGWVSMAVMAVTGGLLSMARLASWEMLFDTRFGILLLIKIALFLILVASATVVTFVIGPKLKRRTGAGPQRGAGPMTAEGLAAYDGRKGRPTYIAYAGKVYDVSNSPLWKEGRHMGKHPAGADLTPFLAQAPHGEEKILAMGEVADFRPDVAARMRPEVRTFYVLAYLNLVPVFLIIFILALWRWG